MEYLELVYDANLGAWIYVDIYKTEKSVNFVHQALRRGYFPYSFNFVFGKRGETCQCSFCGKFILMRESTRDHVWPKSLGGIITTTACEECNTKKADTKPIEFAIWWSQIGKAFGE